mgnify:CR=1 FL=1
MAVGRFENPGYLYFLVVYLYKNNDCDLVSFILYSRHHFKENITIYKHRRLSKVELFYLRLIGLLAFLEVRRDHVSLVRTLHKSLALLLSQ